MLVGSAASDGADGGSARVDSAGGANAQPVRGWHGDVQPGVIEPAPPASLLAAYGCTARDRYELAETLRTLNGRARDLVDGVPIPARAPSLPAAGTRIATDLSTAGTTVTVALGSSVFDQRYGLEAIRPAELEPMPPLQAHRLDPAWEHGDLLITIGAQAPDLAHHAFRQLTGLGQVGLEPLWTIDGFNRPDPAPVEGRIATRNLMGFKDGTANPDSTDSAAMDSYVWVGGPDPAGDSAEAPAEPAWATNGTYQVVRLLRMRLDSWDRLSLADQEAVFGRHRDSGAPLGKSSERGDPDFAADPSGERIPIRSHIRLAQPGRPETIHDVMLRRGFSYSRGYDRSGLLDAGLAFVSYQRRLRVFMDVQLRLAGEPMERYVFPFGGGFFFVLPGVRDESEWLGQALLDA